MATKGKGDVRYLQPINVESGNQKKYCRFKKAGIKYIDYGSKLLVAFCKPTRKNLTSSFDWYFIEIPKKIGYCNQAFTSHCIDALRSR